jgi:hypothetical protein
MNTTPSTISPPSNGGKTETFAEKHMDNDHSMQLMSGGELSIENVNAVGYQGRMNTSRNAGITAFNSSLLENFMKFPTILYNGSVATTTPVGTTIYQTAVSPILFNATSLTRVKNFATNFRQWSGSMTVRIIFTKPIFLQTKVIASFIPGITLNEANSLSIDDLYGAQYHTVMNPDNDNEMSYHIPFISGLNWLDMNVSTGVFIVKLFQPLVSSQPTNTPTPSIPFTLTLSSTTDDNKFMPLTFRYLVNPKFENPILNSNANSVISTLLSPQSPSDSPSSIYEASFQASQTTSDRVNTMVFVPKRAIPDVLYGSIKTTLPTSNVGPVLGRRLYQTVDQSGCSLNNKTQLLASPTTRVYFTPESAGNQCSMGWPYAPALPFILSYSAVLLNNIIQTDYYYVARLSNSIKILFNTSQCMMPNTFGPGAIGQVYTLNLIGGGFYYANNSSPDTAIGNISYIFNNLSTVTYRQLVDGSFNYLIEMRDVADSGPGFDPTTMLIAQGPTRFTPFSFKAEFGSQNVLDQQRKLYDAVLDDAGSVDSNFTHVAFYSRGDQAGVEKQLANHNYSNLLVADSASVDSGFDDRAIDTGIDIEGENFRFTFLEVLFGIQYGAKVIGNAARFVSDICSYVTPFFTVAGQRVGPNDFAVLALTNPGSPVVFNGNLLPTRAVVDLTTTEASVIPYNRH